MCPSRSRFSKIKRRALEKDPANFLSLSTQNWQYWCMVDPSSSFPFQPGIFLHHCLTSALPGLAERKSFLLPYTGYENAHRRLLLKRDNEADLDKSGGEGRGGDKFLGHLCGHRGVFPFRRAIPSSPIS